MQDVFKVRSEPTAEAWLAAIFDRNRLGMAMAAIIRIIATTIKSSINEKPFCLFRICAPIFSKGAVLSSRLDLCLITCTEAAMSVIIHTHLAEIFDNEANTSIRR